MSAYSDAVLSLNPSSYWRFEGASPLADSVGGITLTAFGSPVRVPSLIPSELGVTSNAYDLDGSTMYFQGGDNYDLNGIDFSFAWWMKVESATFGSGFQRVLSKRAGSPDFEGWLIFGSSTSHITFDFDPGSVAEDGLTEAAGLEQDETHFVAYTFDDATKRLTLYVDGFEVGNTTTYTGFTPWSVTTTAAFEIGSERSGAGAKFAGVLDDIAVWSGTDLAASDIKGLWDAAQQETSYYRRRRMVQR